MKNKDNQKELNSIEKELEYLKTQNETLIKSTEMIKQLILSINNESTKKINYCPICGNFSSFAPFGVVPRENAKCTYCGSLERHRFVFLLFKDRYEKLFGENIKFLHFAPEPILYKYFEKKENIDYYPVDFNPSQYESSIVNIRIKVDMENIPYGKNKFDLIYNSHVLEHVPDDLKGMSELYRVLKDDGVCITSVPMSKSQKTLEKKEYNTPDLRTKYYGQKDHLRRYGLDFKDRLESVGFKVEEIKYSNLVSNNLEKELYGLPNSSIFICTKE